VSPHPLLLDTCAAIWILNGEEMSAVATQALDNAHDLGAACFVSPITAWEIGMLIERGRLQPLINPQKWFARLLDIRNVHLAALSPDLLIASSFLPGKPPRDPADRIIAATAREFGATLLTRDRVLLGYGAQGHMNVIAC
jgi:PIN domain nuclease of toxin-antitoxin system